LHLQALTNALRTTIFTPYLITSTAEKEEKTVFHHLGNDGKRAPSGKAKERA
jgi:hypothetical protein